MRANGILLSISSLPSPYGIGCFSKEAYAFVDWLAEAGQSFWQVLPLGPTSYGDSPYQAFSTFAGNPYFIDLEQLIEAELLTKAECDSAALETGDNRVDYARQYTNRRPLLRKAFQRWTESASFHQFLEKNRDWLANYALFMAVKGHFQDRCWIEWDADIRTRKPEAMARYRTELETEIRFHEFLQYQFDRQWHALKEYAKGRGVQIIGDIPIYVALDSSDVWSAPELFELDEDGTPTGVAGVPPDGFSAVGQVWGNPLYNWKRHRDTGYAWWTRRMKRCYELYDVVRIDHFRGFDEYFEIPYGAETAAGGHWKAGPGKELFDVLTQKLGHREVIAEDLGYLTDSVRQLVRDTGFPGMKVLEFAFDSRDSSGASEYIPYNYPVNSVVYTGTHDNETIAGWYGSILPQEREAVCRYLNRRDPSANNLHWDMIALAMGSVAKWCILPMQDLLGLDNSARMNRPSTLGENWRWRVDDAALSPALARRLRKMTACYGRSTNLPVKTDLRAKLEYFTRTLYGKSIRDASDVQLYEALLRQTREMISERPRLRGGKKLYYFSAEFLIGKLLSNNLMNLGIYDELSVILRAEGKELSRLEELEPEPSLGNGGLGRLAACFLDSIASLGLPGDGIGLNYHFGLFRQVFRDRMQCAEKDPWLESPSWLQKTDVSFPVMLGKKKVMARLYDIDVVGYENGVNKLHLFDLDTVDESVIKSGIDFDPTDIERNLTLFLYPDDSTEAGRRLRIYQQYFMVSSGAQFILMEMKNSGCDLHRLYDHAVIQINDTHPTMVIPELIRLLTENEGFGMDEAIDVVRKTCAYTNHTILAEALEKWPVAYLRDAVPQLMPIIWELDKRASIRHHHPEVQIIDSHLQVHMARLDIHYSFSVNGVAAIHTEILKNAELKPFYEIYPEKFNNKTNGITFRRWLLSCNRELAAYIARAIGDGFRKDPNELGKLMRFLDDKTFLKGLRTVKQEKKAALARHLWEKEGISVDPDSIFDIQVKRLHEYKRQQMNALYIIHKYLEIKRGRKPATPITFLFGAKAAPAYVIAQDIIHLLLTLQEIVNQDPDVSPWMKVVMVENYNVSYAEMLIPACDISEQISLASKEASGTSNMKLMLNGAVTLGTSDGANVEIHALVGDENIYLFGEKSQQVIEHYANGDYSARALYEGSPLIREAVDFITGEAALRVGNAKRLERLREDLINKDWFMALLDLEDYIATKDRMLKDFQDAEKWEKMMLVNIAKSAFFSSDRTVSEYNRDIWKLG